MPGGNYPIIASMLGKRKAAGKESIVFWKGVLVPASKVRKETARHGYMTTYERVSQARGNIAQQVVSIVSSPLTVPQTQWQQSHMKGPLASTYALLLLTPYSGGFSRNFPFSNSFGPGRQLWVRL